MNETVEVLPAETIEGSGEVTVAAQNRDGIVKTIARQIEAVKGAELRSTFEKLKLGAMVKQAVTLLGLDSKGGNGSVGLGVKGWWDENFKDASGQPVIPYRTLMFQFTPLMQGATSSGGRPPTGNSRTSGRCAMRTASTGTRPTGASIGSRPTWTTWRQSRRQRRP